MNNKKSIKIMIFFTAFLLGSSMQSMFRAGLKKMCPKNVSSCRIMYPSFDGSDIKNTIHESMGGIPFEKQEEINRFSNFADPHLFKSDVNIDLMGVFEQINNERHKLNNIRDEFCQLQLEHIKKESKKLEESAEEVYKVLAGGVVIAGAMSYLSYKYNKYCNQDMLKKYKEFSVMDGELKKAEQEIKHLEFLLEHEKQLPFLFKMFGRKN